MREARRGLAAWLLAVLAALGPSSAVSAEPLTPERVVGEIRWKESYSLDEARGLVLAVARMYQDEIDRAVRQAVRPLEDEIAGLEELNRALVAELPPDATSAVAQASRPAAPSPAERRLRVWRAVGIGALAVGIVEAALLIGR